MSRVTARGLAALAATAMCLNICVLRTAADPIESYQTSLVESKHGEIASKIDKILNGNKYQIFRSLEFCIEELETEVDYEKFKSDFFDCVDVALKSAPTRFKEVQRIVTQSGGQLSRLRFWWLYSGRIENPCASLRMLKKSYDDYLVSGGKMLPVKSADLVRFVRMCARIKSATPNYTMQYKHFIKRLSSVDWKASLVQLN